MYSLTACIPAVTIMQVAFQCIDINQCPAQLLERQERSRLRLYAASLSLLPGLNDSKQMASHRPVAQLVSQSAVNCRTGVELVPIKAATNAAAPLEATPPLSSQTPHQDITAVALQTMHPATCWVHSLSNCELYFMVYTLALHCIAFPFHFTVV